MKKVAGPLVLALVLLGGLYAWMGPSQQEAAQKEKRALAEEPADTATQSQPDVSPVEPVAPASDPVADDDSSEGFRPADASRQKVEEPRESPPSALRLGTDVSLSPLAASPIEVEVPVRTLALETEAASPPFLLSTSRQADSLGTQLHIPVPDRLFSSAMAARGHPSSTINTPTAYGPGWKHIYAGVGYQNRIRYDDWRDGVAAIGGGLGDPNRYVGLDVRINILDTYTDFAEDRSLSLKLHRRLPYRSAVAVGYENIWHTDGTDGGSSRYVVASKVFLLRERPTAPLGSMVVNLGLGTNRFLSEERFARGEDGVNVFGSLALRLHSRLSAVANWTGQDLALGASLAPFREWPVTVTPAVVDVTGRAGDGARFSMSVSVDYTFGQ